jgi:hemoglobin-like flavoprotein
MKSVGAALLWTFEQTLGAAWTGEARMAWASAYAALAGLMKEAAATCFWGRCL